jgi:hypothetical protein
VEDDLVLFAELLRVPLFEGSALRFQDGGIVRLPAPKDHPNESESDYGADRDADQ